MTSATQCEISKSWVRRHTRLMSAAGAAALIAAAAATRSAEAQTPEHPKWTKSTLLTFNGSDGAFPWAALITDSQGNLYGTTANGGENDLGVVFKIDGSGNETVLYNFSGKDGSQSYSDLVQDSQGNLYGTTEIGGAYNDGVVFELDTSGTETVLYSFTGGSDGGVPAAGLVFDSAGNLYGTAMRGGITSDCVQNEGCGVVFELSPSNGNWTESVLHAFTGGSDGAYPEEDLMIYNGNIYGVTSAGGDISQCQDFGCGVVFDLDTEENETVLYTFEGGTDGAFPRGRLVQDSNGNLYGATTTGGDLSDCGGTGCGVVYKLDTGGNETSLYTFTGGTDGSGPGSGVIMIGSSLYGTTIRGGAHGYGVVFSVDADTGKEKVLDAFNHGKTGGTPHAALFANQNSELFGTAAFYGDKKCADSIRGCGVVFELQESGQ